VRAATCVVRSQARNWRRERRPPAPKNRDDRRSNTLPTDRASARLRSFNTERRRGICRSPAARTSRVAVGIEGISASERPRRDVDWGWNAPTGCRRRRRGRRGRRGREFEQGHRQRGRHGCRRSAQRDARQPGGFGVALAPRAARRRRRNQRTLGRGGFDRCVHVLAPRDDRADPRAAFRDRPVAPSRKHVGFSRSGFFPCFLESGLVDFSSLTRRCREISA
jgi:hypothetical protein